MKKLIFGLVLVFIGMIGFGAEIWHSYTDICEPYQGRKAAVSYLKNWNNIEDVETMINTLLSFTKQQMPMWSINYVEKPYKNETASAYNLITEYYEPKKGDVYQVSTEVIYFTRVIFIWIGENGYYNYWIFEVRQ